MAEIVLGVGTSHTPQISAAWEQWPNLAKTEEVSPAIPEDLEAQLQPDVHQRKHAAVQQAVKQLGQVIRDAKPDAIVMFGDDQHEQFHDENMPAIAIYHGENFPINSAARNERQLPAWARNESMNFEKTRDEYSNSAALASYLIQSLTDKEFEITRCNQLREGHGIGHAFSFLYRRLWPDCDVPIVPIMLNTYYPPNQPTPKRCYALGEAVRESIQAWDGGKRVVVIASGGLSHIVIDEPLDRAVLDALAAKDAKALWSLPREKMKGGTSEILNWVALAGVVAPLDLSMKLLEYVPGYRSKPSTGCAMSFAYWN